MMHHSRFIGWNEYPTLVEVLIVQGAVHVGPEGKKKTVLVFKPSDL